MNKINHKSIIRDITIIKILKFISELETLANDLKALLDEIKINIKSADLNALSEYQRQLNMIRLSDKFKYLRRSNSTLYKDAYDIAYDIDISINYIKRIQHHINLNS